MDNLGKPENENCIICGNSINPILKNRFSDPELCRFCEIEQDKKRESFRPLGTN